MRCSNISRGKPCNATCLKQKPAFQTGASRAGRRGRNYRQQWGSGGQVGQNWGARRSAQTRRLGGSAQGQGGLGCTRNQPGDCRRADQRQIAVKRYLLDTHFIYWWMTADTKLGKATQRIIAKSEIVVSIASVWEMVLKNAGGKLPLPPRCAGRATRSARLHHACDLAAPY